MVKRCREETDTGGANEAEDTTSYKTVFIDTNLDTHLAVFVSDSDTVSNLKKKIVFEHLRCFPEIRELKISSMKVKRKGHYYHLPDTMLVRGVFEGTKNGWFLYVDASRFQCLGNDQGLLCITHPQTEAGNLLPSDKQKVFDTTESYPAHRNLASSSIVKQKEVANKVIGEFKSMKPTDNSQELSPGSGPVSKKCKMHKEDVVNLPVTNTSTSMHAKDNDSEFKVVGNDTTSTNSNEGERENINMKLVDVSADPLRNQFSDPNKVSKLGMKKNRMCGASAEIAGVQDELRGNRNNDTLGETSQCGTVANNIKILDSKESSRGSTEFNQRDILKIAIPENSTAGKPINAALAETLGDQSVRTDTAHTKRKKRRKKGMNSSTCHDEVACMVLGSTDKFEGTRGSEQKEGVEMKIFDKLTDVDSTIHVTQSRLKETSPVKDHASNRVCPAPVSKDIYEMNLVGGPILESIVSGDNGLGTDVANITGEQELIPNSDFEMPMSEKLGDASTRGPVPSNELGDLQGAAENSFGRKRSRAKKSTTHQELDMKSIVEASQNAYASDQVIVRNDGLCDVTIKVGSIMPKTDVDHMNEIGKEGKLSVTQGAETSLPSDNNEAAGATKEQVFSAKRTLADKGNIKSGDASSMKRKKKSRRKSAEKSPDKLEGEDDSRVNCCSLAAGIGSTTDSVTEQNKKGEISFDAEVLQISLNSEVKGSPHNKDLVQVQSAACRSSDCAKAGMTIKEVETISTAPSDVKVAEVHGNSGRSKKKTKLEVSTYNNDVSCAPSVTHDPLANHLVQRSNQDKNALPASKKKGASEQVSKSAYAAGSHHQVEKATCIEAEPLPIEEKGNEVEHLLLNQTDKSQETLSIAEKRPKTKTNKSQSSKKSKSILSIEDQEVGHKDLAASNDNLEDNHFVQGSNQDKNALPASQKKGASEQVSKSAYAAGSHHQVGKKENEVEHLLLNQTDKNQETLSIAEKRPKTKTKKSRSSKKSKSILSMQDQEVAHKDLAASNDNLEDVNPLPEPMEMDESGKNSHVDHMAGTKLENQRNSCNHSNFESSREDVRNADSFTSTKEALEEMHLPDVNTDKSEGINFKQYFVPGQQGEVASKKPTKSNRDTKAGRKSKDGMTSRGTLEDISNSRIEVALPSRSSAQGDKTLEEAGKLATFDAPAYKKKSEESMDESTSSSGSKGSDRFPEDNRRQTGSEIQSLATRYTKMGTGNIEDFTQPKKGLLSKPGTKFGDSRSRRSDSKEGGDSDSMTETPSDSSSSGNSVEGSEISQASTPKGSNVAKSNGAKHKLKSNFLGQDITMDMILRSSSRFKKAKVTAAQCQDEESLSVNVVPDSLADTQNQ